MNFIIGFIIISAIVGGIWALLSGLSDNNKRSTRDTLRDTAAGTISGGFMAGGCLSVLIDFALPLIIIVVLFKSCS